MICWFTLSVIWLWHRGLRSLLAQALSQTLKQGDCPSSSRLKLDFSHAMELGRGSLHFLTDFMGTFSLDGLIQLSCKPLDT